MERYPNTQLEKIVKERQKIEKEENSAFLLELNNTIVENFKFIDCQSIFFEGTNLNFKNCLFVNFNLGYSIFREESSFINCIFINSKLSKIYIEGKIVNCKFIECGFFEAGLLGIDIIDSLFVQCDFSAMDFEHCRIKSCKFLFNTSAMYSYPKGNTWEDLVWIPPTEYLQSLGSADTDAP